MKFNVISCNSISIHVMLFSSIKMKSLLSFRENFVNLHAQMKYIYVLYFLLIVGIYNVHFLTYMLFLRNLYSD